MEWLAVCERYRGGLFGQPVSAVTSIAFVVAGAGILAARNGTVRDPQRVFALITIGVGVGSFIQHGPHPAWQAYAHDLPLAAVLIFAATDAAGDLSGRELAPAWWLVPSAAMVPAVAAGARVSTAVQAALAAAAVGLNLQRARRRPELRPALLSALGLAVAGIAGSILLDRGWGCRPESLVQGHACWHVLAAAALWRLAPAMGARRRAGRRAAGPGDTVSAGRTDRGS